MIKPKAIGHIACLVLLFAALGGLWEGPVMFAAEEGDNGSDSSPPEQAQLPPQGPIEFDCGFPSTEGSGNETFEYDVLVVPVTNEVAGVYDFNVIAPPGWEATVWGGSPAKQVGTIDFGGKRVSSQVMTVRAQAIKGKTPEPGEYVITLEMESGELKSTFDMTAVVTANYEFNMHTATGRLNTEVKGVEDKHISVLLENTGTAAIENITLSSTEPEGWNITFDPDKIDSLEPGLKEEIDVVVKPPERAIAKDYYDTLRAESKNGTETLQLRVTVQTPRTVTGGGIGITASVIVGLIFLFRHLSTRYTTGASHHQRKPQT